MFKLKVSLKCCLSVVCNNGRVLSHVIMVLFNTACIVYSIPYGHIIALVGLQQYIL